MKNKSYYSYYVVDYKYNNDFSYHLIRNFSIENGTIIQKNKLYINKTYDYGITDYEDIGSAYPFREYYYICPKGKFFVYKYKNDNKTIKILKKGDDNSDWDLNCFHQHDINDPNNDKKKFLFIFYLNSNKDIYQYYYVQNGFKKNSPICENCNGLYAYKWRVSGIPSDKRRQMFGIILKGNIIYLEDIRFTLKASEDYELEDINGIELGVLKTNLTAYFNESNKIYDFSWINYNIFNISDYQSGYHYKGEEATYDKISQFDFHYYNISPFEFFDDVKIIKIKLINDKIAYYILYNNEKKEFYYGIIDVLKNKVIFNTNEEIIEYKPYTKYEMLAITNKSIYKICVIKNGENCLLECKNDNSLTYNAMDSNNCNSKCESNLYLKPNDICIKDCDENLFFKPNNNECWLCKDYDNGNKKYKLMNSKECLESIIDNVDIINENLNLIACKKGYQVINNTCIRTDCYENCKYCTDKTNNENDQKCIQCKNNTFLFEEGNCVKKCRTHNFISDNKCKECSSLCETCSLNSDNCTSCKVGQFLFNSTNGNNACQNCSLNCKTCINNKDFCIDCNTDSKYKYFFNNSCLEKCPENMKNEDYKCIDDSKKDKIMFFDYIIICGLFFILIILCFYKRFCKVKNTSDKIEEKINTELTENISLLN